MYNKMKNLKQTTTWRVYDNEAGFFVCF